MDWKLIGFILLCVFYVAYTINAQIRIIRSAGLAKNKKIINSILIWLIPFIWFFLFKDLILSDNRTITKNERDRLLRKDRKGYNSGFHGTKGY